MTRLIDADLLKDRFENLAYDDWNQGTGTTWANAFREAANMVEDMPTADAVEVVRCRDCKWWDIQHPYGTLVPDAYHCKANDRFYGGNHFCAYGERRKE